MKTIKRNPLGIRKIDVQEERRDSHKAHRIEAARMVAFWQSNPHGTRETRALTDEDLVRMVACALSTGWEAGVTVGVAVTKDRIKESLENGTLTKNA